jgi:hypothetical protein
MPLPLDALPVFLTVAEDGKLIQSYAGSESPLAIVSDTFASPVLALGLSLAQIM